MDVIVTIYNKLDEKSPYRSDIFDLFGTQDGMSLGIIGSKKGGNFRSLEWDWGDSGIKKVCKFLYWNTHKSLDGFEAWYSETKTNDYTNLTKSIDKLLYVFKYKGHKVTAFIARVHNIKKRERRIWFRFTPLKFVLLPPEFMEDYRKTFFSSGREDPSKWKKFFDKRQEGKEIGDELKNIFSSSASQDLYHLIPIAYLEQWVEEKAEPAQNTKPIFVATIEDNNKLLKKRLQTNNQIFWSIFSQYIGKSQVKGSFCIIERGNRYSITDIPVNSFTEKGLVYNQEVGTPYVVFQALSDIFQEHVLKSGGTNRLIDEEFLKRGKKEISIFESRFLRRAERVSNVAENYQKEYASTDYDYVLDFRNFGINKIVVFDLTSGLWKKYIGRDKKEYVNQWFHNIIEIPKRNKDIIAVWHYGLEQYDGYMGEEIGKYLINKGGLTKEQYLYITKANNITIPDELRVIFLPFYDDNAEYYGLKRELTLLEPRLDPHKCKDSCLYKSWKAVAKHLLNVP